MKAICIELATWYLHYYQKSNAKSEFLNAYNTPGIAPEFALLVGDLFLKRNNHMYYLWRFRRNWAYRDELLRRIRSSNLWSTSLVGINTFEDLYRFVWGTLNNPKIPMISQLVIYDISVRLVYLQPNNLLMPKDIVYIHALPMTAFNLLIKKYNVKGIKRNMPQVPYSQLARYFPGLDAFQIEDLLCQLGKSLRRVKNGKSSVKEADWDIDNIIRKYRL